MEGGGGGGDGGGGSVHAAGGDEGGHGGGEATAFRPRWEGGHGGDESINPGGGDEGGEGGDGTRDSDDDTTDDGTYHCIVCDVELFSSETKYDAGCGWPSFYQALDGDKIENRTDTSHGMARTETVGAKGGAHLGHVFPDGPAPTGDRFCMNSASLSRKPAN